MELGLHQPAAELGLLVKLPAADRLDILLKPQAPGLITLIFSLKAAKLEPLFIV